MKKKKRILILLSLIVFMTGLAGAQELIIYPAKGQSQKQIEADKYNCYTWAKQQTGFDPMQTPTATQPPPRQTTPTSNPLRGAARGAAVGAAAGGIAGGDAGKGAAAGAAAGALIGGMKRRDQARAQYQEEQVWAHGQANDYSQKRNTYNRAYSACLESKGYTVK
jgi:hypothetical protein